MIRGGAVTQGKAVTTQLKRRYTLLEQRLRVERDGLVSGYEEP